MSDAWMRRLVDLAVGFCVALFLFAASASSVTTAIAERDIIALEALRGSTNSAQENRLATGAALALRHRDEAALAMLAPLSLSQDGDLRAGACRAMADVYLRQGRYGETRDALRCADAVAPLAGEPLQVLHDAEALAGEKPMQLVQSASGRLHVRRDSAGLIRVPIAINGNGTRGVIDTDASFCAVSQSAAGSLGLRLIDKPLSILTSSRPDQPMRLGVADRLQFGEAVLTDVVFAVLPDRAVRFGPDYRMDVVIGLPVLVALRRIADVVENGSERFEYGPATGSAAPSEPNMALSGLDPFVVAKSGDAVLRLAIDSAADKTTLNATAVKQFPALAAGASSGWAHWQGAGGGASDRAALTLPELTLAVAGRTVALKRVKALSADERDRHGALGQDAMKRGWTMDFDAMRFRLAD